MSPYLTVECPNFTEFLDLEAVQLENKLILNVQGTDETIELLANHVFNAGYAGSDQEKVQEHIDELAKLGVPVPSTTPTLYPIADYLPTTTDRIQVQHQETSGEIEYVLIRAQGEWFVTVGSDHTDRKLETFNVPMSKQAYPNIIAQDDWRLKDVKDHWEQLELLGDCGGRTATVSKRKLCRLDDSGTMARTFCTDECGGRGEFVFLRYDQHRGQVADICGKV